MPAWGWALIAVGVSLVGSCFVLAFLHAAAIERATDDELDARLWSIARWREFDRGERVGF